MSSPTSTTAEATLAALADPVLVRGTNGTLEYVNEAAARLLGAPADALVGLSEDHIVPSRMREVDGSPYLVWLADRYRESGRPVRAPLLRADGVEVHQAFRLTATRVAGQGVAIVAVLRPPGDPREIESDPLALEGGQPTPNHTYQAVFDAVPVGVLHFDARGRITDCNEIFVQQMGSSRALLRGLDMLTLPDSAVVGALRGALAGAPTRHVGDYLSVTGGRKGTYQAAFSPIFDGGKLVGGVGIVEEISERRELEARLATGERMASLGRLAAGVAHEINNPLAYVRASLDVIRRDVQRFLDDGDAEHLESVLASLGRADDGIERVRVIAGDLKTFSRGDDGSWSPVSLARVAEIAVNLVQHELRHAAALVQEIEEVAPVLGSETRFVQVFVNLLVNAAQAVGPGDSERQRVTLRVGPTPDGRAYVEVEDTGPGIAPELAPHVFEPFWTSKASGGGTGLGLSICHGIITSAGGEIRIDARAPGKGALLRIELPTVIAPPAGAELGQALAAPALPSARPASPPPRLLLVDDEPLLVEALREGLSDAFEVEVAQSGPAALALLAEGPFDLVLCDVMMPRMSGMQLFERVSETNPEQAQRFVFMTGGAFTDRARAFLEQHALRRLHKPFDLAEVHALLEPVR